MQHRNRLKRKKDRQKNGHKENRRRGDYLKKCLENSSAPTAWDATRLHIHYSASLESSHPAVARCCPRWLKPRKLMTWCMLYQLTARMQRGALGEENKLW